MNQVVELPLSMPLSIALHGRCSVRNYRPEPVDRLQVRALLAAAVRAPTAMHREPWAFVVVQDRARLRRLSDRAKPLFAEELERLHRFEPGRRAAPYADPDFNLFYNAGTLIVVCGPAHAPFVEADCWLAAAQLMLAAYAMGLGTCVIGSAVAALNLDEVKAELQIPPGYVAVAPIIVGTPALDSAPSERKELRILHWH